MRTQPMGYSNRKTNDGCVVEEIINPSFAHDRFDVTNGAFDTFFIIDIKLENVSLGLGGLGESFEISS